MLFIAGSNSSCYFLFRFRTLFLFYLLIAWSCNNKNTVKTSSSGNVNEKPVWVENRPVSSSYYTGIGSCSKLSQPLDYQAIAKKNAFNDLATEISVKVQGSTFLNTLEVNKNFSEEFISTISTSTNEQIEDYEMAGIWEDRNQYWVYYRLNKSDYQRKKLEKKNMILSQSNDYYRKGLEAEASSDIPAAVDFYLHGLFVLKPYWNEVNEYTGDSGKMFLDNELYSSLQRTISGLAIRPSLEKLILSPENGYSVQFPAQVLYQGRKVRGIALSYSYQKINYMKPRRVNTDENGTVTIEVNGTDPVIKNNVLDIAILTEALIPADVDRNIALGLIKNARADRRQVPIELITPVFFIETEEKVYGQPGNGKILSSSLQGELLKRGMRISQKNVEANYGIYIHSDTNRGGTSQGFTVAFLQMTVTVKDLSNNAVVFEETPNQLKGIQLNEESASEDAYKKGKEKIEQQIVKGMLDAIL